MPWYAIPRLHLSSVKVCDQMTPARRLLGLLLRWRKPHTSRAELRPGTAAVVRISAAWIAKL